MNLPEGPLPGCPWLHPIPCEPHVSWAELSTALLCFPFWKTFLEKKRNYINFITLAIWPEGSLSPRKEQPLPVCGWAELSSASSTRRSRALALAVWPWVNHQSLCPDVFLRLVESSAAESDCLLIRCLRTQLCVCVYVCRCTYMHGFTEAGGRHQLSCVLSLSLFPGIHWFS